ncbi:S49 family peptidase [Bradyrhizobium sp. AUGA SZCCT0158]|uniref:S49 family peptidase n=1 Tax=Bradyrhizobium sp. AUGA SZCCT0158 TaxID=2807661 RepID=UPI001BAC6D2A|nr:S49 family peptidase [Bradyrhizobium sp. AUGA SZCCT0158]MBR1198835.1 S49 family peptidase [Bradyrhizobium sp. AUGA SZCCT0158]
MTNPLLARFIGVPALLAPHMRERFESTLAGMAAHEHANALLTANAYAEDGFWPAADDWRAAYRPYVIKDGILQIPVKGVLLHDFPWALGSWATGYIYIARALERGLADPMVQGIALLVDSYGGEVAGCFELVDKIYAARSAKPIAAFAHEYAFSAGYAVASAARKVAVSRTGGVGSIGVVTAHVDYSEAMKEMGVKVTFIFAGKHKVDGNRYEPLPADVQARIQSRIDALYDVFVKSVARNRSMEEKAVRGTEALDFTAAEAVENGLADSIAPLDDGIAAFSANPSDADDQEGDDEMSGSVPAAGAAATAQAALDAARAEGVTAGKVEGRTEGRAEGVAEGATAERTRIGAILGSEEAKGRSELAQHFAFNTSMSADDAKAALKAAPKQEAAAADPLATAMSGVKNPQVGADANADQSDDAKAQALAGSIVTAYRGKPAAAA